MSLHFQESKIYEDIERRRADRHARRNRARDAATQGDGIGFINSQDGYALEAIQQQEQLVTVSARQRVGEAFLKFVGDAPITIDLIKAFLRTDVERYAASSMWTRRSHLRKFLEIEVLFYHFSNN